jgi:hypothetical protein
MEHAKNSLVTNARYALYASYVMFAIFVGFSIYFTIGNPNQIAEYVAILLSIVFLVLGSRSKSIGLLSFAWIINGIYFVIPFVYSPVANYLTVIISVLALLVSYELARFNFETQPLVQSLPVLQNESLGQLRKVTRNHNWTLFQVVASTMLLSITVGYLLPGLIAVNPPELGVTVFASISLLLIACVLLQIKD